MMENQYEIDRIGWAIISVVLINVAGTAMFASLGGAIGLGVGLIWMNIKQAIGVCILSVGAWGAAWLFFGQQIFAREIVEAVKESRKGEQ